MSYAANPNFAGAAAPVYVPTIGSPTVTAPVVTGSSIVEVAPSGPSRLPKIIIITVLVILIIVSIILIFVFRGNLNTCESNENPACPILVCPVGQLGVVADPDCGDSAFRFGNNGAKKCSVTRYAP